MTHIPDTAESGEHGYVIDAENAAAMARLMLQDRLLTKTLGGLVPEQLDLSQVFRVVDVACGPGGWLLDLGMQYPHIQGMGIDISQLMIDYASSQAASHGLPNVQFRVMDATGPLDFPNHTFDLVNDRLIGFFPPSFWPKLLKELLRITRPGGAIRVTEVEMSVSNSPALEQEHPWFFQSFWKAGQSFSSNGHRLTITAMLAPLLRQAGCSNVATRACGIDWSSGTEAHDTLRQNALVGFKLIEPFYLATGVATQAEMDLIYAQMLTEMQQPHVAAMRYDLTACVQR